MTPEEALNVAVKAKGIRGVARAAGVSPGFVSRIANGHLPIPLTGKLAEYLGIETRTVTTVRGARK